jgi:hypothetical protein
MQKIIFFCLKLSQLPFRHKKVTTKCSTYLRLNRISGNAENLKKFVSFANTYNANLLISCNCWCLVKALGQSYYTVSKKGKTTISLSFGHNFVDPRLISIISGKNKPSEHLSKTRFHFQPHILRTVPCDTSNESD